ncbi:MAG: lytic transglycosylase domain-containing protein, partial [Candidatus Binatia bacterium]
MRSTSLPRISILLVLFFVMVAARESSATKVVYTKRDVAGVSHFSNVPLPGWQVFDLGTARPSRRSIATRGGDPRASDYHGIIRECAERYGVEPALVKAMIRAESAFDPRAVSPKGARGLMQLMPHTARRHGVANLHDPSENIRGGVGHLRSLLDRFENDLELAIGAYNAGAGSIVRYGGLPPYRETRAYV